VALTLLTGLAVYAWRGSYARYITDDYCTSVKLRDLGFVDAMLWHRNHWSGRYAYFAVKAIPEAIGKGTTPFTPAVTIALFCAAAIWAIQRTAKPGAALAWTTGLAIVFASIDGTPDILAVGGVIMWETATLTYMLPLLLYCLWAAVFFMSSSLAVRCTLSAILLFIAGGLSETSLAAQGALTGGVLFFTIVRRIPEARKIAAWGFFVTLASALVSVTAPGNVVRMSELPPQPPLTRAIFDAFRLTYSYVGSNVFVGGASLVAILACGLLLGRTRDRREVPALLFLALIALGAFTTSILPSTWMLSSSPPPRALHVSNFFFIGMLLFVAAAIGAARARVQMIAAVLLVLAIPLTLRATSVVVDSLEEGRKHAAEVDRIGAILRASPGKDVVIRSPHALAERLLVRDPAFWTNVCICEYYGARTLSVTR
jgi:hypothetical protein